MYFDTIQDLKNAFPLAKPTDGEYVVGGYWAIEDGGGGTFVWVDISKSTLLNEDYGIIIWTDSSSPGYAQGYFKRIYSGSINVRWFGAKGNGIADDTAAVHAARDSEFCKDGGTIYFPKGVYIGAFEFISTNGEVSILGDGMGSVLKSPGSGAPKPVLTLGWHAPHWRYPKVSNITIDGASKYTNGVEFDDNVNPNLAGRWIFENVMFANCQNGIYKPMGNIGNSYINCTWRDNDFGYYATDDPAMHAGCERFIGGSIEGSEYAGICVVASGQYGQLIIDGIVIETNPGFGIFVKLTTTAQMTFGSVEVRNCWMEGNRTSVNPITIDNVTYQPGDIFDYYYEGVRSVSLYDCYVFNIKLITSSVAMYNCRTDNAHWSGYYDVDDSSVINAFELRNALTVSENIFVHSLSYDASSDVWGRPDVPTSVWGPLRVVTQTGNKNIMVSQRYEGAYEPFIDPVSGTTLTFAIPTPGGILRDRCSQIIWTNPGMGVNVIDPNNFFDLSDEEKYYVWSIHSFGCTEGDQVPGGGWIGNPDNQVMLGQVITKPNQWTCSYGVKKLGGNSRIYLGFSLNPGASILFCDYQVLQFDNYAAACSFLNSRAFAEGENPCKR